MEMEPAEYEMVKDSGAETGTTGYVRPFIDPSYLSQGYFPKSLARAASRYPETYDMREDNAVSSAIRDQTKWGTCWAFAAVGSAESSLYPEDDTVFSPRHLAYFNYNGKANPDAPEDGTAGDTFHPWVKGPSDVAGWWHPWYEYGGNTFMANATLSRIGIQLEDTVPYPENNSYFGTKYDKNPISPTPALKDQYLKSYGDVEEKHHYTAPYCLVESNYLPTMDQNGDLNGDAIKQALMNGSSVSVTYDSYKYIDYSLSGKKITLQQFHEPRPDRQQNTHAVQIIGWNDAIPKEAFAEKDSHGNSVMPDSDGGWLIRNSWGKNWRIDGYFYLSYEDYSISEVCQFIASSDQPYDHNYQYDGTGWGTTIGVKDAPEAPVKMSNVFTATGDEMIKAAAFYTTAHNASYSIQVYTNIKNERNPESGEAVFSEEQTGNEPYAGYHTIQLDQPAYVEKGETFSVVVEVENPVSYDELLYTETIYPVACEIKGSSGGVTYDTDIQPGESFISLDGKNWKDVASFDKTAFETDSFEVANVCLKAFTVDRLPEAQTHLKEVHERARALMNTAKYQGASDAAKKKLEEALQQVADCEKTTDVKKVEQAAAALQDAIDALDGKPADKSLLKKAIETAESAKLTDAYKYDTSQKQNDLNDALKQAKIIDHEPDPTQEAVDEATNALNKAREALSGEKTGSNSTNGGSGGGSSGGGGHGGGGGGSGGGGGGGSSSGGTAPAATGVPVVTTSSTIPAGTVTSSLTGTVTMQVGTARTFTVAASTAPNMTQGNGKVAQLYVAKPFNGSSMGLGVYGIGRPGESTGIYANGKLLFTISLEAAPFVCDTTQDIKIGQGKVYWFKVTPNSASLVPALTVGNGRVLQTAAGKKETNQNGTVSHYFAVKGIGPVGSGTGVYINMNGMQYRLFNCGVQ